MNTIITTFVNPPIPIKNFDWNATFHDYEEGDFIGHGSTEDEAIEDLLEKAVLFKEEQSGN